MEDNNKEPKKNDAMEWGKCILTAFIIAFLLKNFVFNTTYVLGNSMYPTLYERDRLFALKVPLYFSGPHRGDVVILEAPDDINKDYIKRVVGVEGDRITIIDGKVYVNDELLVEDYIEKNSYTHIDKESQWSVPRGEVFVLGDNREPGASKDSRTFGTVSIDKLKGVTGFRYFPFDNRFGKIN